MKVRRKTIKIALFVLLIIWLFGLTIYALGGGFLDKSKLFDPLTVDEVPYLLKIDNRSYYCKSYVLKDGSVIIENYYTNAGFASGGMWMYWNQIYVVLGSNVQIRER